MKKYGVWGFGVVGKSAAKHLSGRGQEVTVYDDRPLSTQEHELMSSLGARHWKSDLTFFLTSQDAVIPSPGIDISPYKSTVQFTPELDLFLPLWQKPLIAVTGSLGKTTLVTILGKILAANERISLVGGNIGTPMLDLLDQQEAVSYAILELSSFQLEWAQPVRPDLAIITNMYANHLDRHGTMERYIEAKSQIFTDQKISQKALLPLSLAPHLRKFASQPIAFFSTDVLSERVRSQLHLGESLYTLSDKGLEYTHCNESGTVTKTIDLSVETQLKGEHLVRETWLTALAALDLIGLLQDKAFHLPELHSLPHRMEYVGKFQGVTFYNDSKSTIFEATYAAVHSLAPRKVHLLLGGLSKGVDRAPLIGKLKHGVTTVACFGKEAKLLSESCTASGIDSSVHGTLQEALKKSIEIAKDTEIILLSPAGSSFDLYENYEHRGNDFKRLFKELSGNE